MTTTLVVDTAQTNFSKRNLPETEREISYQSLKRELYQALGSVQYNEEVLDSELQMKNQPEPSPHRKEKGPTS